MKQLQRHKLSFWLDAGLTTGVAGILVLIPFHAFLTVWASSLIGHYTLLRLWKEAVLALLLVLSGIVLARDARLRRLITTSWLWRLVAAYVLLVAASAVIALHQGSVSLKAAAYGGLLDVRFWLFFLVAFVATARRQWLLRHWPRLVLVPAGVVVLIGLLQRFVLPHDVLKHFGYGPNTIAPFETIDHKVQYLRVQSTLRGANLLGAYLIIVLAAMTTRWRGYRLLVGSALAGLVLFLSGSRGAWIGAAAALAILAILEVPGRHRKQLVLAAGSALVLIGLAGIVVLRHNAFVQNTFFHTDNHSHSSVSSNSAHFAASRAAAHQVLREPFGRGPGTAGPASVYDTRQPARIAEDYFLQIAQEYGWAGLVLFLAPYVFVGRQLWQRRAQPLARGLFAALIGLSLVGLLMHIWTDDTVAYLFWGLAGLALAPSPSRIDSRSKPSRGPSSR